MVALVITADVCSLLTIRKGIHATIGIAATNERDVAWKIPSGFVSIHLVVHTGATDGAPYIMAADSEHPQIATGIKACSKPWMVFGYI